MGVLERAGAEGGACSEARLGVMAAGPAESFRVQATACHRSLPLLSSRRFFSRGLVLFGSFVPPPRPRRHRGSGASCRAVSIDEVQRVN